MPKRLVKEVAARLLCAVGLPWAARRRSRGRLAVLMFHGVTQERLSPPCWHVHDAATLRKQLKHVRRCFNVLPLEEALERLRAGTLPDRAAALTFDDGTRNLATNAAPILRELALPAAVFVSTGPMGTSESLWPDRLWLAFARTQAPVVDLTAIGLGTVPLRSTADRGEAYLAAVKRLSDLADSERIERLEKLLLALDPGGDADAGPFQLLSWDEARDLASDGSVTLHPHSVTHPMFTSCTDEKIEREVSESCAALTRETSSIPTIFTYPNGRYDERAKAAMRRHGIRWALSSTGGFAYADSDPLALPRVAVGSDLSFAQFKLLVSGALEKRSNRSTI